jgi:hypothetical protein
MATIDLQNMKLIVEKNLKDIALIPDAAWKDTSTQNLRDAIAQCIVDSLSDVKIVGTLSAGTAVGNQTFVTRDNLSIMMGPGVAGVGTQIKFGTVLTPEMANWIIAAHTFMTAANSSSNLPAANAAYISMYANPANLPVKIG